MASLSRRLKNALHPRLDPLLSKRDEWRVQRALSGLPDGTYTASVSVPYRAQFATPELIHAYIHDNFDGTQDPNWRVFGADDPAEYAFWAPRICPLACLQMAIAAFETSQEPTLWQLVKQGLTCAATPCATASATGWTRMGLPRASRSRRSTGWSRAGSGMRRCYACVTKSARRAGHGLGVAGAWRARPAAGRYGGHFALVTGFEWRNGAHFVHLAQSIRAICRIASQRRDPNRPPARAVRPPADRTLPAKRGFRRPCTFSRAAVYCFPVNR